MGIEPIIEKDAEDGGRDGGNQDAKPFLPDHHFLFFGFLRAERPKVIEEIEDNGEDSR